MMRASCQKGTLTTPWSCLSSRSTLQAIQNTNTPLPLPIYSSGEEIKSTLQTNAQAASCPSWPIPAQGAPTLIKMLSVLLKPSWLENGSVIFILIQFPHKQATSFLPRHHSLPSSPVLPLPLFTPNCIK